MLFKLSMLIFLFIGSAFQLKEQPIKLWMIGDSTMCYYGPERAPATGWGMPFANFFDPTVQVENRAKAGRSTRTFLTENRWKPIADSLAAGDYVFIQFGHNDEAKEEIYKARYTPVPDFKKNLIKFITESRLKKAIPILVTPVSRMRFDKQGNAEETHQEYTAAVVEVGKQQEVPVIDLDRDSRNLFQEMGPERSKMLFMQLEAGVNPIYLNGLKDNTHFNEFGARMMAQLVLKKIRALHLDLVHHLVKPVVKK